MSARTSLSQSILESRYQEGRTFFHTLSPGWKLVAGMALLLAVSTGSFPVLVMLFLALGLSLKVAGVSLKSIVVLLRSLRWLLLMIGLFPVMFTPGTQIAGLGSLPFPLTWEGLELGTQACLKLITMFFVSLLLTRTTPPYQLIDCVKGWVVMPIASWREKILEVFTVGLWALQLIPVLCVEAERFILDEVERLKTEREGIGVREAWAAALLLAPLMSHLMGSLDRFEQELSTDSVDP